MWANLHGLRRLALLRQPRRVYRAGRQVLGWHGYGITNDQLRVGTNLRLGVSMFRTFWITYGALTLAIVAYATYKLFGG